MRAKEFIKEDATGAIAKTLGKSIPFVGAGLSGLEAIDRYRAGDYTGAAIAGAGVVPGISWGTLGAQAIRDKIKTGSFFPSDEEVSAAVAKDAAGKALASKPSDEKPTQTGMIKPSSVVEPAQKEIPLTTPTPVEPVAKKELPISSSWQDLYKKNIDVVGSDPNLIFPGQVLTLPGGGKYTVKSGDTLSKIAAQTQGIRSGQNVNIDQDTRKKAIDWSKQQSVSTGKQPTTAKTSTDQSIGGMARSGARHAADLNNPTGLGWNGKTWTAYDTPEQGVAATQQQLSSYLSGRGVMKGRAPTPENVVSMWVTGGSKPAEEIQGGAYVQSVKNELARAGVKLGPKGEIPNSPEATLAITRAMVKHETAPKNREKFYAALYPERQQIAQKSGTKIS